MKKLTIVFLLMILMFSMAGCNNRSMNYIIQNEPNITGMVKTITNDAFLMENETGEYWVSLKVENKDSIFNRNDNPQAGTIGLLLEIDYNTFQDEETIQCYLRRYSNYERHITTK